MPSRLAASLALAAVAFVACGARAPSTPTGAVAAFASAVESASSDPTQRRRVYDLLSRRARDSLTARAARASQVSGWELRPWDMLAPGRMRLRVQVSPESLTARESGDRAVVTVRGRAGGVADVPLVREEGEWRVDLALPPVDTSRAAAPPR